MSQPNKNDKTGQTQRPMFDQDSQPRKAATKKKARRKSSVPVLPPPSTSTGSAARPAASSPEAVQARAQAKTKLKKSRGRIVGLVALLLVVVLVIVVLSAYAILANRISGENTQAGTLPDDVKTLPEYTGNGVVTMLICGIDYDNEDADGYATEDHIGRTDLILYLMYDTVNNKANILQIPRDTYVGDDVDTGGTGKINNLYYNAPDPDNRMSALARVINDQLGLPVDYYLTIDMDAVKEIIDIKGTLSVYVPIEVSDPDHPEAVIAPGWRDFTSDEAEFFLRNRKSPTYQGQSDIMRLQMQQSFYSALYREFKTLAPSDLLMWMEVLLWRVSTDMDPIQIGGLAQTALKIQGSDITFIRPSVSGAMLGKESLVCLMPDETAELLNTYFRSGGDVRDVDELDIQTLPIEETVGVYEANIRTMADVQATEPAA